MRNFKSRLAFPRHSFGRSEYRTAWRVVFKCVVGRAIEGVVSTNFKLFIRFYEENMQENPLKTVQLFIEDSVSFLEIMIPIAQLGVS